MNANDKVSDISSQVFAGTPGFWHPGTLLAESQYRSLLLCYKVQGIQAIFSPTATN